MRYSIVFSVDECVVVFFFFFFNDTATTEIYTLSLHDALPISSPLGIQQWASLTIPDLEERTILTLLQTALTSSHRALIYLVLMLTSVRAFFSLLTNVIFVAILVLTFSGSASRPLASVMYIVP